MSKRVVPGVLLVEICVVVGVVPVVGVSVVTDVDDGVVVK